MGRILAWVGGLDASVGLLCCFTGLLPFALTAIGAAGLIDTLYRDSVLLSFTAISFLLFVTGLWMIRR